MEVVEAQAGAKPRARAAAAARAQRLPESAQTRLQARAARRQILTMQARSALMEGREAQQQQQSKRVRGLLIINLAEHSAEREVVEPEALRQLRAAQEQMSLFARRVEVAEAALMLQTLEPRKPAARGAEQIFL